MSAVVFKKAKISVPVCLFLVLVVVFSFLMMPGITKGNGVTHTVTTFAATDIGVTSATLHGNITAITGIFHNNHVYALPAALFVWGTSPGGPYPNLVSATYTGVDGDFFANLTGLLPGKTYYYKAGVEGLVGKVPNEHVVFATGTTYMYGQELNFTTLGNVPSGGSVASGDAGTTIGVPADVHFNYINLSPAVASAGQPVTVVANAVNRGTLEGGYTANLQINGYIEQTTMGTIAGNTAVPVEFTIVKDTPGTYNVDIGGQTASFTVVAAEETGSGALSQSQIIIIALVILGIAAVGLSIVVIMRRRSSY
jgi:hypothetical protein